MVSFLSFPWNGRDPVSISNCRDSAGRASSDQQTRQQRQHGWGEGAHGPNALGVLRGRWGTGVLRGASV